MKLNLPKGYEWLDTVGTLPRTIQEGLALLGVAEVVGKGSNKTIIGWRDELNQAGVKITGYSDDDIAWCGLFAAIVAKRAEKQVVTTPLWARSWVNFGVKPHKPALGDVLVFERGSGGHVGFYIAEDPNAYHVLGGNQSNKVCITRIVKGRLLAARRPKYNVQPESVKAYAISATGKLSVNEA